VLALVLVTPTDTEIVRPSAATEAENLSMQSGAFSATALPHADLVAHADRPNANIVRKARSAIFEIGPVMSLRP
jgi:hypothetical protein